MQSTHDGIFTPGMIENMNVLMRTSKTIKDLTKEFIGQFDDEHIEFWYNKDEWGIEIDIDWNARVDGCLSKTQKEKIKSIVKRNVDFMKEDHGLTVKGFFRTYHYPSLNLYMPWNHGFQVLIAVTQNADFEFRTGSKVFGFSKGEEL